MNISELIRELEMLREEFGDVEVRMAYQPSWPFEYSIGDIRAVDLSEPTEEEEEAEEGEEVEGNSQIVVYIGEAGQIGYLPGVASRELGWR